MQLIRPGFRALTRFSCRQQLRTFSSAPRCLSDKAPATPPGVDPNHPVMKQYLEIMEERRRKAEASASSSSASSSSPSQSALPSSVSSGDMSVPTPPADFERFGDLSDTSIFNHPNLRVDTSASSSSDSPIPSTFSDVDANALATALDPQPRVRKLWERKQAIRIVRRRGRLTKDEQIARSERSMMINSPLWDTSVKKVMLLARQISGKSIEDAIMQMHFSKKVKNGQRMKEFLEHARNQAMSTMGMGLGLGNPVLSADAGYEALNPPRSHDEIQEKMDDFVAPPEGPVTVTLKDNKKLKINDPKGIYLARVWVVRGPYRKEIHFRSRHRATYLQHPSARLFMILKEEVTRIRESTERQARLDKRKVWVQLPDRPITAQNQHLMW